MADVRYNYIYEGVFYMVGRGFVCQLVTFARCAFIFAMRNIALGGYLDTRRNIIFRTFMARRTDAHWLRPH